MTEIRYFDKVSFDVGDIVVAKHKEGKEKPETIIRVETIKNLDNFAYDVIFFESDNGKTFHVSFEYEPYNKKDKELYYNHWKEAKSLSIKNKSSSDKKSTKSRKQLKFKL